MKKGFDDLYEDLLNSNSQEFNELSEKAKKEQKTSIIVFLVLALIIDYFLITRIFSFSSGFNFHTILFLAVPLIIIDTLLYVLVNLPFSKNRKQYSRVFKETIIKKLFSNFYNKLLYSPNKKLPSEIYDEAKYKEYYNRYYSEDYMEGLIGDSIPIQLAEVKTVHEETHRDSDGRTHTTRTTKFYGLFAKIEMIKSINSDLLIRTNRSLPSSHRLEMDSQEFEKYFDVSASNSIIGMQLLTHDIMELLISFRKLTKIPYDISIYKNVLYLRFHTSGMFELQSIKKGAFDKEMLRKYYDVLDFSYTLSKTLIELIEKTEI